MEKRQVSFRIIAWVCGVNLLILLGFSGWMLFSGVAEKEGQFGTAFILMLWIGGQMCANVLGMLVSLFIRSRLAPQWGLAFVVAFFLVGLVGASVCFGGVEYFVAPRPNGVPH